MNRLAIRVGMLLPKYAAILPELSNAIKRKERII